MVDHRRWLALLQSHLERLEHELGAEMTFHRPTDNAATPSVEDDGQIQESRLGPNVGDVGDPELIRPVGREVAIYEVGETGTKPFEIFSRLFGVLGDRSRGVHR